MKWCPRSPFSMIASDWNDAAARMLPPAENCLNGYPPEALADGLTSPHGDGEVDRGPVEHALERAHDHPAPEPAVAGDLGAHDGACERRRAAEPRPCREPGHRRAGRS